MQNPGGKIFCATILTEQKQLRVNNKGSNFALNNECLRKSFKKKG
jgi:hypothetical protein